MSTTNPSYISVDEITQIEGEKKIKSDVAKKNLSINVCMGQKAWSLFLLCFTGETKTKHLSNIVKKKENRTTRL